jgi:hypothetical protein
VEKLLCTFCLSNIEVRFDNFFSLAVELSFHFKRAAKVTAVYKAKSAIFFKVMA